MIIKQDTFLTLHLSHLRRAAQQTGSKVDPASVGGRPSGASRSAPGRAGELTFSQGSGNATAGFNGSSPTPSGASSSAAGRAGELTFSKGSGNATAGFNSPSPPKLPEVVLAVGGGGGGGEVPGSGSSGGSGGDESSPRPGSGGPEETPDAAPWTLFAVGLGGAMFAIYDRIVKPQKAKEAAAAAVAAAAAAAPVCVKKSCCKGGKAATA